MNEFDLKTLKQYFKNIIDACENKNIDERPYIKTVAECGLNILNGLIKK